MSFIRPKLRDRAGKALNWTTRHAEALAMAGLGLLGGLLILRSLGGGWLGIALGAAMVVLAVTGGVNWWRRSRFSAAPPAAGVVEITEARVGYLGPQTGGFVDLDALEQIDLVSRHPGQTRWRLLTDDGSLLEIPLGARGAEALLDAFAALPGMEMGRATAALDRLGEPGRITVWRRAPGRRMPLPPTAGRLH